MARKRVSTRLDPVLYKDIREAAQARGISLAGMVRRLLRLALDYEEDAYWVREGERRLATWDDSKALTHEQVWGTDGT